MTALPISPCFAASTSPTASRRLHWFVLLSTSGYSYGGCAELMSQNGPPQVIAGQQPHAGDFDGDGKSDFATDGVDATELREQLLDQAPARRLPTRAATITRTSPRTSPATTGAPSSAIAARPASGPSGRRAESEPGLTTAAVGTVCRSAMCPCPATTTATAAPTSRCGVQSDGTWYILASRFGYAYSSWQSIQWGLPGDIPVPGDYDNDGRIDPAIWRPSEGDLVFPQVLAEIRRGPGDFRRWQWGEAGDIPVPNDYDGDGQTDLAVWRPSTGVWYHVVLALELQPRALPRRAVGRPGGHSAQVRAGAPRGQSGVRVGDPTLTPL